LGRCTHPAKASRERERRGGKRKGPCHWKDAASGPSPHRRDGRGGSHGAVKKQRLPWLPASLSLSAWLVMRRERERDSDDEIADDESPMMMIYKQGERNGAARFPRPIRITHRSLAQFGY